MSTWERFRWKKAEWGGKGVSQSNFFADAKRGRKSVRGVERVSMVWGGAQAPLADRRIGEKNGHNGIIFHGCRSRSTLAGPIEQDRRIDLTVRTYRTGVTSSHGCVNIHKTWLFDRVYKYCNKSNGTSNPASSLLFGFDLSIREWIYALEPDLTTRDPRLLTFLSLDSSLRLFSFPFMTHLRGF